MDLCRERMSSFSVKSHDVDSPSEIVSESVFGKAGVAFLVLDVGDDECLI